MNWCVWSFRDCVILVNVLEPIFLCHCDLAKSYQYLTFRISAHDARRIKDIYRVVWNAVAAVVIATGNLELFHISRVHRTASSAKTNDELSQIAEYQVRSFTFRNESLTVCAVRVCACHWLQYSHPNGGRRCTYINVCSRNIL